MIAILTVIFLLIPIVLVAWTIILVFKFIASERANESVTAC